MKMLELANGSSSGKLQHSLPLVCLQDSIFSKFIKVTVSHLFNGWTTGTSMISQDNFKMVHLHMVVLKVLDIVTTTTI